MAASLPNGAGQVVYPDCVIRYDGPIKMPVEYHSEHAHIEKIGIVRRSLFITGEMARRQDIIFTLMDTADARKASAATSGDAEPLEELRLEGETLEEHQKAFEELKVDSRRVEAAFAELNERVRRDERARRQRCRPSLLL